MVEEGVAAPLLPVKFCQMSVLIDSMNLTRSHPVVFLLTAAKLAMLANQFF